MARANEFCAMQPLQARLSPPAQPDLKDEQQQEVGVGETLELLEQILRNEGEQRVLGGGDLVFLRYAHPRRAVWGRGGGGGRDVVTSIASIPGEGHCNAHDETREAGARLVRR